VDVSSSVPLTRPQTSDTNRSDGAELSSVQSLSQSQTSITSSQSSTTVTSSQSSAITFQPTSDEVDSAVSSPPLFQEKDDDLRAIRESLHESPLFLANPDLLNNVEWVEFGRRQKLVVKNPDDNNTVREPAVLEWVGEISPINFWLYPCGGWNGERGPNGDWEKASPFETAKARAVVRCPSHEIFSEDWSACITNTERLMSLLKKDKSKTSLSIIQNDEIKIRHALFEVIIIQTLVFYFYFMVVFRLLQPKENHEQTTADDGNSDDDKTVNSSGSKSFSLL
jgi:hypothetical protein